MPPKSTKRRRHKGIRFTHPKCKKTKPETKDVTSSDSENEPVQKPVSEGNPRDDLENNPIDKPTDELLNEFKIRLKTAEEKLQSRLEEERQRNFCVVCRDEALGKCMVTTCLSHHLLCLGCFKLMVNATLLTRIHEVLSKNDRVSLFPRFELRQGEALNFSLRNFQVRCPQCRNETPFSLITVASSHVYECHFPDEGKDEAPCCPTCDTTFTSRQQLTTHQLHDCDWMLEECPCRDGISHTLQDPTQGNQDVCRSGFVIERHKTLLGSLRAHLAICTHPMLCKDCNKRVPVMDLMPQEGSGTMLALSKLQSTHMLWHDSLMTMAQRTTHVLRRHFTKAIMKNPAACQALESFYNLYCANVEHVAPRLASPPPLRPPPQLFQPRPVILSASATARPSRGQLALAAAIINRG